MTAGPEGAATPREAAVRFLRSELAHGPVAAAELLERARASGHADRTVKRARSAIGARVLRVGDRWLVRLPEAGIESPDGAGATGDGTTPEGTPDGADGQEGHEPPEPVEGMASAPTLPRPHADIPGPVPTPAAALPAEPLPQGGHRRAAPAVFVRCDACRHVQLEGVRRAAGRCTEPRSPWRYVAVLWIDEERTCSAFEPEEQSRPR